MADGWIRALVTDASFSGHVGLVWLFVLLEWLHSELLFKND